MKRISLRLKFTVLIVAVVTVILVGFIAVSTFVQLRQAEDEMLEKAQILASELDAFWQFMEINENRINTDSNGEYDFKGLYCVVAAKSVSALFTENTDYTIHYTNLETRRPADAPDEFEVAALTEFNEDASVREYYAVASYNGKDAFRYIQPLYITESCLKCHGEPAGEPDLFGYPKEGMQLGAVAGAVSIVMPVHDYFNGINNNIALTVALIAVLIIICGAVLFFAVTKLVSRPLRKLEHAAQGISTGDFDVDLPTHHGVTTDEVDSLSFHIQGMAIQLSGFYKNLETMVENRTTELEAAKDELNALNARLVEANDRLMRENDYKSEYLAIMSHELRTPLTSILAFAEMWDSDLLQGAAPNADAVGEVRANARILLRIVDNILEMSRIEAGQARMTPEPVDVVDVLSVVARTMEPLARRKDITLTFAVDDDVPIIMSDYEMLRRILDNLMSNAVKYTHRGGSVIAHACYDAADDMLRISVSDDGIGLKEDEMANIFERFVQHSASSYKKYSGTGLGLAVVSELVNLLGGDIEVRSVYKQGSTFTVSLPVQR